ncbi:MAG TPA: hypothetical protein VF043_28235 [Ktedonobacteraceae bacterium]
MVRHITIGLTVALVLTLALGLVLSSRSAGAASTSPTAQFFHAPLTGQTMPDNGTTTMATVAFTVSSAGALDVSSLQDVSMNGTCCATLGQNDTITATVSLDGTPIVSISKSTTNGGAFSTSVDVTTTHTVTTGAHMLTVVYTTSTNPNPPPFPGRLVTYDGTLSLGVVTTATSN